MNFFSKITSNISLFFSKIVLFIDRHIIKKLKEKDLLKRILFTILMMTVFVILGLITLPGIKATPSTDLSENVSFFGIMNTIGGGGLRQFSLVSLGISPFITASLVMTFAQTKICPPIYRLYQSGRAGRVKINYITYSLTLFFALIQGIIIIQSLKRNNSYMSVEFVSGFDNTLYIWVVLPLVLVAGTFFSIFISEQITNKGVGNGSSMLILVGSIISIPQLFTNAWNTWISNRDGVELFRGIVYFAGFILAFIGIIFIISFIYQAERKVPIQQTGVGRSKNIKDLSYLPMKLNPAGIMPIIFASMLITLPMMIVNLIHELAPSNGTKWMIEYFSLTNWFGITIFASATFGITIFLSLQQARIDKIVEDFNKVSTFIPGLIPGEQTEDYLYSIVLRLSIFSAIYLVILGSSQYVVAILYPNAQGLIISGTSLMIITTVSIETIQQIEARWKVQNIFKKDKKSKKQIDLTNDVLSQNGGSILW